MMLMSKRKDRIKLALLIIYGLANTFEQWSLVLQPFTQWQLVPRVSMFDSLLLNNIGYAATIVGSIFIAQLIDNIGPRSAALVCAFAVGLYQVGLGNIIDYNAYAAWQLLLVFNHMPTVIEALIGQLVGEDGDVKERARLMMRLTIPQSVAFAVGPHCAIQVIYYLHPTIAGSQTICGIANILTLVPFIAYTLPDQEEVSAKKLRMPLISTYLELLKNSQFLWTLLFVLVVTAPYSAYNQVLRQQLSTSMLTNPSDMAKLAFFLGLVTIAGNMLLLPHLQRHFGPQKLLMGSLFVQAISYVYLAGSDSYTYLLIGLPFQLLSFCIANGLLTGQLMSNVPRAHMGKAAALNRITQLAASLITPLITGYYVDFGETRLLCFTSAFITALGLPLVHYKGSFMRQHLANLPVSSHAE